MSIRTLAAAVLVGVIASPALAEVHGVDIQIGVAPPPDREVVVPAPRTGYVYERPHYEWDGNAYVWRDGRYIEERPGHVYVQPQVEHRGEHWFFHHGHWDDD